MNRTLRVSFESPQSGWMSVGLSDGAGQRLVLGVSHAPVDSLPDLVLGLTTLLSEGRGFTVRWNCEPEEYDFSFTPEGDEARLDVTRYPDHRRSAGRLVFSHRAPKLEMALTFWKELRGLYRRSAEDVFEKNWRRPFPQAELQKLTKLIRASKRAALERAPAQSAE